MMAACSAVGALAVDTMLPGLPAIGVTFRVTDANQLQWVILLFLMGSGLGQIVHGPLSDSLGRRRVLLAGLLLYVLLSLVAGFAPSLGVLYGARLLQGFAAAATAVVSRSIVRDLYAGATMARVTSTVLMVFLSVPILAPSLGQLLLHVISWRGIFGVLMLAGGLVAAWIGWRLPETLPPERRRPLGARPVLEAFGIVLGEPVSRLYILGMMLLYGSLLSYISLMPQLFHDALHAPALMGASFAACAGAMAAGSFANSRLVERLGMARISHTALLAFIAVSGVHSLITLRGTESVVTFTVLQGLQMACFALTVSNFGALAMQPMGSVAGIAASIQGLAMQVGGAVLGSLIGMRFSGSVAVLPVGALLCGCATLMTILVAERGRYFRHRGRHHTVVTAPPK